MKKLPLTMHSIAFRHNALLQEVLNLPKSSKWFRPSFLCEEAIPDEFSKYNRQKLMKIFDTNVKNFELVSQMFNFPQDPGEEYLERLRCVNALADLSKCSLFDIIDYAICEYPEHENKFLDFRCLISPKMAKIKCIENPDILNFPKIGKLGKFFFGKDIDLLREYDLNPADLLFLSRNGEIELDEHIYKILTWWCAFRTSRGYVNFIEIEPENPQELRINYMNYFNDQIGVSNGYFYAIMEGIPVKFRI